MSGVTKYVRRHPVIVFFLLAYAITWSAWIPIPYAYERGLIEITPLVYFLYVAGSFGPLLSGAIVTRLTGGSLRRWFGQALKWRVPLKWWMAALFTPLVVYALMAGIHLLLGGQLDWSQVSPLPQLAAGFVTVFLWGGGNEELGWRGFALPHLQNRYDALLSSLIIGVVWTLWHAPPGIIELGVVAWAVDLPFYMATVTGISVVATWLYNGTGGSVLLTMVFHAAVNVGQSLYPVQGLFTRSGDFARLGGWLILILGLVVLFGPRSLARDRLQTTTPVAAAD